MGKSHYTHGGGINHLCLPLDPESPSNVQSGFQSKSYIYGVEYQSRFPGLLNQDAPCAVCEVQGRSAVLMIPAKQTCPAGWTLEYEGLLTSDYHTHKGTDFICVSSDPEAADGGHANQDGGLLYVVEAQCGSLPCPPYVSGHELSCVVCTK